MEIPRLVLSTVGTADDAKMIARLLVEERLAACVSIMPVESYYAWEGTLVEDAERMLVIKSSAARIEQLERRLREVRVRDDAGNQLPLVASEFEIQRGRIAEPADPPAWTLRFLATGLLLAALLYWLGTAEGLRRRGFGIVAGALWLFAGLGGITLLGLWFGTTHEAAWRNHNLALFHPLCLLLLPAAWRALRGRAPQARTSAWIAAVILASAAGAWLLLVLPGYRQQMIDWIALWLPIHASAWWVLQRRA
jgi:uncharacterized protein involved in tolerance to divalent cations